MIPNGVEGWTGRLAPASGREGWVVAARLDEAKGVVDLLRDWPPECRLDVYGTGPQQAEVERVCRGAVVYKVQLPYDDQRARLASAHGLLMPSKWLEMNPPIVSDALALGTPVVALASNVAAEVVEKHRVGATYTDPHTLRQALEAVVVATADMEDRCVDAFEAEFSYRIWTERLSALYANLLGPR